MTLFDTRRYEGMPAAIVERRKRLKWLDGKIRGADSKDWLFLLDWLAGDHPELVVFTQAKDGKWPRERSWCMQMEERGFVAKDFMTGAFSFTEHGRAAWHQILKGLKQNDE